MRKVLVMMLVAALALSSLMAVGQETAGEQFSIATLNVDGLPPRFLIFKVNPDGPGEAGTARIGQYLMQKGYDLVMMQEDFNYHDVLIGSMKDSYRFDTWSGDVSKEGHEIDYLHLQNHRFECDGLMACWKNDLTVTATSRTPWKQCFGKFCHSNDELITKGFRRYEVTLRGGADIVVYNMHMEASEYEDEVEQKDAKDREARMSQWLQLREEVLQQLDTRPVIIVGDMNSYYGQEDIQATFVDAINATGRGTVSDVWKELRQTGGETVDKILYINPATGTKIQPMSYLRDRTGYVYDGKALGDHWPVSATFQVVSRTVAGPDAVVGDQDGDRLYYNLEGKRLSQPYGGVYIERSSGKSSKKIAK